MPRPASPSLGTRVSCRGASYQVYDDNDGECFYAFRLRVPGCSISYYGLVYVCFVSISGWPGSVACFFLEFVFRCHLMLSAGKESDFPNCSHTS